MFKRIFIPSYKVLFFTIIVFYSIGLNAQQITDSTKLARIHNFCYQNNFFEKSFYCYAKDSYYIILPSASDSTCKQYSTGPVVIDTGLTKVLYGYPCSPTGDMAAMIKFNAIPWMDRSNGGFDEYLRFDFEDFNNLRDYDYVSYDANLGGGYLLPRCKDVDCVKQFARDRFGLFDSDTSFTVSSPGLSVLPNDTILVYRLNNSLKIFNVDLIKDDIIVFYGFNYFILSGNQNAADSYSIKSNGDVFAELTVDTSTRKINFTALKDQLTYINHALTISASTIGTIIGSQSLSLIKNNQNSYLLNNLQVPPNSIFYLANGKSIALKPGAELVMPSFPKMKMDEWIFFRNNIPSSYVFTDTLNIGDAHLTQGGTAFALISPTSKVLGYHIKSNSAFTVKGIQFAPNQWMSMDSSSNVTAGYLNSDQTILGVPLASLQNTIINNHLSPQSWDLHPFKIYNGKVVAGFLSKNYDYSINGEVLPLGTSSSFSFNKNGDLELGTFYKTFNYKSHSYNVGDKITYSYLIDTTVTLLNSAELQAVAYYFDGSLQDITKKTLLGVANKSYLTGNFGDNDITQNTTYSYVSNGILIHNHVHVNNFQWQAWPLHNCDCDIDYNLSLKWSQNSRLNTIQFFIPSVWAQDAVFKPSFCPLGPGILNTFAEIYYIIFSPFLQITPQVNIYQLDEQLLNNLTIFKNKIDNKFPLANLTMTNLYIDNNELKASFEFNLFTR